MTQHNHAQAPRQPELSRADFGEDFKWGASTAAYQIEGAHEAEGKGLSIWDVFSGKRGKVKQNHNGNHACDFFNRYPDDLALVQSLAIPNFRFSLSWPRLLPEGHGQINRAGVDYYNRLIDHCLELNITPWITLYHWDLPQALERKGGWANRDIVGWFEEYVALCIKLFGDRVKHWMVLNEPMVFTGAGYFLGVHAPGRRGFGSFIPAVHHAALCQAEGGRIIKQLLPEAEVGTTFSCSYIEPLRQQERDIKAAVRVDALLNRLFLEPSLGLGYPLDDLKFMRRIEKYVQPGDEGKLRFDFDFIGVQNYTREVVKYTFWTPFMQANLVSPKKRGVPYTLMNWEVYPEAIYHMLQQFGKYKGIKKLVVTENGAAFADQFQNGQVHDPERMAFLQRYLAQVLRAKQDGVNVQGYFVWSLVDNFEWAEGYDPRFGLVHVDFATQARTVKSSGYWYRDFLKKGV
ncbi:GH1 family beta-glucosidase [Pontibacter akesuensis]|uniref:Beta-glucosidase n=1 Tax=Pontibacter akesuensis TaxID=388950 RepID=A0A1I7KUF6_9BACT|nr:GH1 family beta-glucosidase [Pontibacter akesuensis]GHA78420.1 beta-glucosidase [Pontibacter akesuensis]SFV01132.1 beta-glucosidase [Pontibacter akesuensis]